MKVRIESGDLHVGVDGILGQKPSNDSLSGKSNKNRGSNRKGHHTDCISKDKTASNKLEHICKNATNELYLEIINGNLTNFGTICAKEYLLLKCNTLMLCEDSKYDTASKGFRSYTLLQKKSGYLTSAQESPKTRSSFCDPRFLSTVKSLDSQSFISLLNEEVDPTVTIDGRSVDTEFQNICMDGTYDRHKDDREIIRGSLNTWKWKHGKISSTSIECVVKDINDCSQLQGDKLAFEVEGTVRVVKPWRWNCGEVSGTVKKDFLFYDDAALSKFNNLRVVRNFRIFPTSTVWVEEGGELITGEEFENNNLLISNKNIQITVGYMKQARDSSIISNEDLLIALHEKFEDIWFGKIYADHHLFLQLNERVVCDACCVAKEVYVEFYGESAQLFITQILLAEIGDLHMWAEIECESPNFVLSGKLNARGIQAETTSVTILPEAVAELTCPTNANKQVVLPEAVTDLTYPPSGNEVNVITRWLKINNQAIMMSKPEQNMMISEINNSFNLATNIYCEEYLLVDGVLGALGSDLNIYAEALTNSSIIKLSPTTSDQSSISLRIECDKDVLNSGIIESEGNMIIDARTVYNEAGIIKSSPNLGIFTRFVGETSLCGKVFVDKQLLIHSESKKEFTLNVTGGKREGDRIFTPPDQMTVECDKANLKIHSSIICPDMDKEIANRNNNEDQGCVMVLSLYKCVSLTRDCALEDVRVQFTQIESEMLNDDANNNNANQQSKFSIQNSMKIESLYLCSGNAMESDVAKKESITFEGSYGKTVIDTLEVDRSIDQVTFGTENLFVCTELILDCETVTIKTNLECVEVDAHNLNVHGRMRCMGQNSEEEKSLVNVKNTVSVVGSVECVGSVEIFTGETFQQAETGNISVKGELLLETVNKNGHLSLDGLTKGEKESVMKIVSDNVNVSGNLSEIHTLTLDSEIDMTFSENSKISCDEIYMTGEWITTAGTIDKFSTLSIKPWAIINSGSIDSENESSDISFQSDLTLINSGICCAKTTYLEAPFLLSLPGTAISNVNDVGRCQLVGKDNLKLESIACFLGGSSLLSCKRYENLSVLLFKFLTYVACTPDSKSLEAWSKAAESLRNIQSQISSSSSKQDSNDLKTLMNSKQLVTGTEVDLRIAQMYDMVNDFIAEILKNGIKSFDARKLVHILTIESERYTRINILKEKLLQIPENARRLRQLVKKGLIKMKKTVRKRLGFSDPKMKSQGQDGIFESGFYSFGDGVTLTDSLYEAAFVEVLCDEGFIIAMDFLASSKDVVLSKREKKAVAMMIYSEKLHMENVDADQSQITSHQAKLKNIKSKTLDVNASDSVEAEKITSDQVQMKAGYQLKVTEVCAQNTSMTAKDVNLKDIKSTNLDVQASKAANVTDVQSSNVTVQAKDINASNINANDVDLNASTNARLQNINSDYLNVKSDQSIIAENVKGKNVSMKSSDINVSILNAENARLEASNDVRLRNIQSTNVQVQASKTIDAKNIKGESVFMESGKIKATNVSSNTVVFCGQNDVEVGDIDSKVASIKSTHGEVKATGRIVSDYTTVEAQEGINLAYNKNGISAADHQFKSLQMKTNKINNVNELLKGDGIYKDLKICDELGLVVSDQDVIFSRCVVQQDYKLNLNAKSVSTQNSLLNWRKGASITSNKTMEINDSSITSQKSIALKSASGNVNMNSAQVQAGEIAMIEASKGSIRLTGTSVSGDQAAIVKAKGDVIIDPVLQSHSNSSSRSGFFSSSRSSSSYSTVTKSSISSSKGAVALESREGKVQATAVEFNAEKGLHISAAKDVIIRDKITIREEVSVEKNWFRKKRTANRIQESHKSMINSRGPVCIKSKTGNILATGTDFAVKNDMFLEAAGTVKIQDRILSKSQQTDTSGFSLSLEGLSYGESNKRLQQQQLAGSKLQIEGNLVMKGKNVFVANGLDIDAGNMVVDADVVKFEGAELNNSFSETSSSINIGVMSANITEEKGWGKEKKIVNQNINVRGETMINARNVTLAAANLNTGTISGDIENLDIISKQSQMEAKKQTETVGFVVAGGFPVPSKYGRSESCDQGKFVEKSSGIHTHGSINKNQFKVGKLHLKGSYVTANGNVANFAQNVISEKINSYRSQTASGFNFGVSRNSAELGMYQSEKTMEMEHVATIGSLSGTVAGEIKQSVNTDLSKHNRITRTQNSNLGFNVRAGKDGCAASIQIDDVGVGFSASKQEIGVQGQVGDTGFSVSGGSSGASLSLQNGENSLGVGLTNQGIDMNIRSKDTAIGASLGKNAFSATVQYKDNSIGASSDNGSKSLQTNIGDFQSGITRNKNAKTGERSTSAHISKGEVALSAATSKQTKSFALKGGEYGLGLEKSKNTPKGKSKYSGNIKAKNFEIEGSTSKHQKTIGVTAGKYHTKFNKEQDSKTGKSSYGGNLKLGDVKLEAYSSTNKKTFGVETTRFQTKLNQETDINTEKSEYHGNVKVDKINVQASSSQDQKSFGLETPEFQTKLSKQKDLKTGKSKYDGSMKAGKVNIEASSSEKKTSFGLNTQEFQTKLSKEKDSKTGKSKYDASIKVDEINIDASFSEGKQSFGLATSEFQAKLNKEKDSKTGQTKYDGNLKAGKVNIEASSSGNKKSLGLETPKFQTKLNKEKDLKTGKSKYDGNMKAGKVNIEASSSGNKTSLRLETPKFQTKLNKEKDLKTGKSKYDGNMKAGKVNIEASSSEEKKSFGLETPEFQTKLNKEKDSKTGKSKYGGNMKAGKVDIEASASKDKKSFELETPEYQTKLNKEKDLRTGKSKFNGDMKAGKFNIKASSSKDKKSFGLVTPEFQTKLSKEKDSKTGQSRYDGNMKAGKVNIEASSSEEKTSFGLETPEFQTKLSKEKDSKTGLSRYDGNMKAGKVNIEASSSEHKTSFGLETPEFQTKLSKEKDSKTGLSRYDGNMKAGKVNIEASSSEQKTSFGLETPEFQTKLSKEKDSKTGLSRYDGNMKAGKVNIEASSSEQKTSFGLETPEFQTKLSKEKDSKTGLSRYDGNMKAGKVNIEASSSEQKTSFGLETPEFQTKLSKEKDSKTGLSRYDGNMKAGKVNIEASSSEQKTSFGLETPEFQTKLSKEKDSKTGLSRYDGNMKAGKVNIEASSSEQKTSFGLETPEFQTKLSKEKDSKTGLSRYDGNMKAGKVNIEASSSEQKTSFGLETPEFQTKLSKEKDSKTGQSRYDGNMKAGKVNIEASSSEQKTSFGLETPEFQTKLSKEKDSKTGLSRYDGNMKAGKVNIEASSSEQKTSFGLETPEFQTKLSKEKDSKTGLSRYDGNMKAGKVNIEASSSEHKTSFGLETPEFQTKLSKEKDSKTGLSRYDGNMKAGKVNIEASSSEEKTSFGLETPEFQTKLNEEIDLKTGKSKYDGGMKAGKVNIEASSSEEKTSFTLETPEFQTKLDKEKDSKTGQSRYHGNMKAGKVNIEASSSEQKTSFGLETPEFQTKLNKEKDSKTGLSRYDGNMKAGKVNIESSSSEDKTSLGLESSEFQTKLSNKKDSTTGLSKYDGILKAGEVNIEAS